MLPQLTTIGPVSISTFGTALLAAFVVGAFLVWRSLRDRGVTDEKIFDHLLLTTGVALIGARLFFVATHFQIFSENLLRIFLLWRFPGISFWGALLFGLTIGVLFAHKQKLSLPLVFDSYAKAVPFVVILIGIGVFLDGSVTGAPTTWPIGVETGLTAGRRHPVGAYAAVGGMIMLTGSLLLNKLAAIHKLPKSVVGWATLSVLGILQLVLAFARADLLYFEGISLELLFATVLTVGPLGPLFVLLNGPELLVRVVKKLAQLRKK